MEMNLFSFGEKVDFLKDWKNLSFDNSAVNITDLSYEVQDKQNDLTIYSVSVSIKIQKRGQYAVKSLIYNGQNSEETNKEFLLGKIYFIYEDIECDFIQHGCNTNINNNEAIFTFSADNIKSFTIVDVIIVNDNKIKYKYNKNVRFKPGKDLEYKIIANSKISKYDLTLLQPIFEIKYKNKKIKYFSPHMPVHSGVDMTYNEIKEYVK